MSIKIVVKTLIIKSGSVDFVEPHKKRRRVNGALIKLTSELLLLTHLAWYLNFCPPMEASYINPPSAMVNTATPPS